MMLHRLRFFFVALLFVVSAQAQQIQVNSFGPTDMRKFQARMVDDQLGYILLPGTGVGPYARVMYTTNGGDSWQQLPLPNYIPDSLYSGLNVHFTSPTSVIMVVDDRVYHSTNAGQSWNFKFNHLAGLLQSCFDGMNGLVMAGYGGEFWITTNGGQFWSAHLSVAIDDIPVGCSCQEDMGYVWYSPFTSAQQTFLKVSFGDQFAQNYPRTGPAGYLLPDLQIQRSFYPIGQDDWIEGLSNLKRTRDGGLTFNPITSLPNLLQGYSLGSQWHMYYSIPDTAFVRTSLDDLTVKEVIYRLPDSLRAYYGVVFGTEDKQFMVCISANEQMGSNQWAVQDLKLLRRQGSASSVSENEASKWRIYPNPTQDRLFIDAQNQQLEKLEIVDLSGRLIVSTNYDEAGIDVSALVPGVYLLRMSDGAKTKVVRFVKR